MTYAPPVGAPPWLAWAAKEIGQREKRVGHNARIIEYHAHTTLRAKDDETPWCASFVNAALERTGFRGTKSAAAASFLDWGRTLLAPRLGCVTIIRARHLGPDQRTGSSSGNHVGLWVEQDAHDLALLGGNQGDAVSLGLFDLADYRVLGWRWPHGITLPPAERIAA